MVFFYITGKGEQIKGKVRENETLDNVELGFKEEYRIHTHIEYRLIG